ncbi:winged helix-turn-helix domain-containing protein [Schauerella aestuarii]|uniref:winged helix-turn-helix domain-containing protein n=1 Tax=Schauerella aestuarii TaxID=2511204 RepID=UPI00136E0FEC|nr:winged helix-turn-helix domain-containing protein [Achromobacter aestuarii]MYZ41403.1 winged helix-turn-helix domain-containing protein [Achromobacter aestuarii]
MSPPNYTYPAILQALEANGDMTMVDLVADLQASRSTIQHNLRRLQDEGKIHVCGWVAPRKQGLWAPVYTLGAGVSPKMPRQAKAEVRRRQLAWHKKKTLTNRLAANQGNVFATLIAQVA